MKSPTTKCNPRSLSPNNAPKKDIVSKQQFYSQDIVEFIKSFEGFEDILYTCAGGKCTIGYGHVVHWEEKGANPKAESLFRNPDGSPKRISETWALSLLEEDINNRSRAHIIRLVKPEILDKLNQNQRDALISFVFNIGSGNFASSTLLKRLNEGNFSAVPNEMKRWNKSKGKVLQGLVKRRNREALLFETPIG